MVIVVLPQIWALKRISLNTEKCTCTQIFTAYPPTPNTIFIQVSDFRKFVRNFHISTPQKVILVVAVAPSKVVPDTWVLCSIDASKWLPCPCQARVWHWRLPDTFLTRIKHSKSMSASKLIILHVGALLVKSKIIYWIPWNLMSLKQI